MTTPRIPPIDPPYPQGVQAEFDKLMRGAAPLLLFRTVAHTHVEMMAAGRATAHLGHRSADLARKHYIDGGLAYEPTLPPAQPVNTLRLEGPAEARREAG